MTGERFTREKGNVKKNKAHKSLNSCREGKEWFRCSVLDAIYTIRKIAGKSLIIENDETGNLRFEAAIQEAVRQEKIKNRHISVKKFVIECIKCKQSYDVTLNRYEDITICPNCQSPQKVEISWDKLNYLV